MQNVNGTLAAVNPPHQELYTGAFITADTLYLQSSVDDLNYAVNVNESFTGFEIGSGNQKILEPHFRWDWGGRISVGYQADDFDAWDFAAIWTYVHGKGHSSIATSLPEALNSFFAYEIYGKSVSLIFPSWGGGQASDLGGFFVDNNHRIGLTSASADWMLNFNVVDLDLGRSFYIGEKIALHPFVGVRGAAIDQDYTANYSTVYDLTSFGGTLPTDEFVTAPTRMKADNDYYGAGIRGGFDFLCHFMKNWGVSGLFSGSLLYGKFHVKQNYEAFTPLSFNAAPFPLQPTQFISKRHPYRICCNLEGSLGTFWEADFNKDKNHLFIGIFYEIADWFDQNALSRTFVDLNLQDQGTVVDYPVNLLIDDTRTNFGDLFLSGVSFKLRFDF